MGQLQQAYFRHGRALAQFKRITGHKEYWEDRWQSLQLKKLLESAKSGYLNEFEYAFMKYLPKDKPVLEAGCGSSMYVCALKARGIQIEGMDYADETIDLVKEADPTLDVRVGDIYNIDREDNFYGGYISIGVLEHLWEGPQSGLKEAYRVLQPGGVALFHVPYMNWQRRRMWQILPEAETTEPEEGLRFYQDHYQVYLFSQQIKDSGFEIIELYPYSFIGGFVRDWSVGRWLQKRSFFHWRLARLAKRVFCLAPRWLRFDHCHMMLFVCRRPIAQVENVAHEAFTAVAS